MTTMSKLRSGVIAADERHVEVLARGYRPGIDPARRLALVTHGAGQEPSEAGVDGHDNRRIVRGLVQAGFVVVAPLATSLTNWGNPASEARLDAVVAWSAANLGTLTNGIVCCALSMGNITFLNWARTRMNQVSRYAGLVPAYDLNFLHDNNVAGVQAGIRAAYGGAEPTQGVYDVRSPFIYIESMSALPGKVWYSGNDPIAAPATAVAVADRAGWPVVNVGNSGHTTTGIVAADVVSHLSA